MLLGLLVATGVNANVVPESGSVAMAPPTGTIARDPFPRHEELTEQVNFWRNVYGYWGMQQVALHDMDYPGIIYEVIDLPGPVGEGYTAAQKKFIEEHRKNLEIRLISLEHRYRNVEALSDSERELLYRIYQGAGHDVVPGASKRVRSQRGLRERFQRGIEISGRYEDTFREIFKREGLPADLAYIPHVESSFQAHARSSAGAVGIWQFTRSAGRLFLKLNSAVDERMDPVASARGAARYLNRAHDVLGNWAYAVTSYNHGVTGMLKAKKQFGDDFPRTVYEYQSRSFGFASRNFYTEFLAAREVAGSHPEFFPDGLDIHPPLQVPSVVLDRRMTATQLAQTHGVSLKDLAASNPAWTKRAARGEIPLPAGIEVWLPERGAAPAMIAATAPREFLPAVERDTARSVASARKYHVVRRKETLFAIAKRYGVDVATLRDLNNMASGEHLVKVGQKLLVVDPGRDSTPETARPETVNTIDTVEPVIHVVRRGETAFDIASNYGVSLSALLDSNDLHKHSVIYPGQKFRIPKQ